MSNTLPPHRSAQAIILPLLALSSLLLNLPILIIHVQFSNLASASLISWIMLENVFNFVNPLIWPTDQSISSTSTDFFSGKGLCDVETKFNIGALVGCPGALVCIFVQLAMILNTDKATVMGPSKAERMRRHVLEGMLCWGVPVVVMALQRVVQMRRFDVFGISGCYADDDSDWVTYSVVYLIPLLLCCLAAGLAALVIWRLLKYRRQFAAIIASVSSAHSQLNRSRFLRLFTLSTTMLFVFLPLAVYLFVHGLGYPTRSFSWSRIHGPEWNDIVYVPTQGQVVFDRWLQVGCGYTIFLLFGFGKDAVSTYRSWLLRLGIQRCFPWVAQQRRHGLPEGFESQENIRENGSKTRIGSVASRTRLLLSHRGLSGRKDSNMGNSVLDRHASAAEGKAMPSIFSPLRWSMFSRPMVYVGNPSPNGKQPGRSRLWNILPRHSNMTAAVKETSQKERNETLRRPITEENGIANST